MSAEIMKALYGVIQKLKQPVRNQENNYYHTTYADLGACLDAVKKELFKAGLAMIQSPATCDEKSLLRLDTEIFNEEGQVITFHHQMPLPDANPQNFGKAMTYLRRYAINALFLQFAEEDDDGNYAQKNNGGAASKQHTMKSSRFEDSKQNRFEALERGQGSTPEMATKQNDCYLDFNAELDKAGSDEDLDSIKSRMNKAWTAGLLTKTAVDKLADHGRQRRYEVNKPPVKQEVKPDDVPF